MTTRNLAIAAALTATLLCAPATAADTACAPASPDAVSETMRDMYAALMVDDSARLQSILLPDFYSYDGGKTFDGPGLANLVKDAHKAGKTFVWTVNEPKIQLHCDWAWIAYVNNGSITDASGPKPVTWLETAVLRYEAGRWRIALFHSSRAAPPQ